MWAGSPRRVMVVWPMAFGLSSCAGVLARLAVRDDIYSSVRALTFDVLAVGEPDETGEQKIEEWRHINGSRLDRARRTLTEVYADGERDLATLSVAARQIRNMTRTSGTGTKG